MGNPANLVIVENGEWQLDYDHLVGCRMLDALAFGPAFAVRYVRASRVCPSADRTGPSWVWADGGAVIDLDRKRLLFFGDELMWDMPIRRVCGPALRVPELDVGVGATNGLEWIRKRVFASLDEALNGGGVLPSPKQPPHGE
ncbi:hypothetical protein ABQF34_19600 [Mycolicibacterium boenickei]